MRGNIWAVVVIGALLAFVPGIINGGDSEIASLLGSLSPVVGLLLFVTAMGLVIKFMFGSEAGY